VGLNHFDIWSWDRSAFAVQFGFPPIAFIIVNTFSVQRLRMQTKGTTSNKSFTFLLEDNHNVSWLETQLGVVLSLEWEFATTSEFHPELETL